MERRRRRGENGGGGEEGLGNKSEIFGEEEGER